MNNAQSAILALAQRSAKEKFKDEFSAPDMTEGMSDELKAALKELQADEAKNAVKEAAKEIMTITRNASEMEERAIASIRAIRQKAKADEEMYQRKLASIRTAREYAFSSSNYLPLMSALGNYTFNPQMVQMNAELFRIPEAATPAEKKDETPAARKNITVRKVTK